jgi:hypothetical protein
MQTHPHHQSRANEAGTDKLRQLLGAEMSAVETYTLSLESIDHGGLHHTLQTFLASHSHRVDQIRGQLEGLRTEPVPCSGVWAHFAKAFHAGADLGDNRAAIAALEEGEDHLLRLYEEEDALSLDAKTHRLIQDRLILSQRLTQDLCRKLESYLTSPS